MNEEMQELAFKCGLLGDVMTDSECPACDMPLGSRFTRQATHENLQAFYDAAVEKGQLWQPIETAPKDGSRIIAGYGRQSGFPVKVVFFNKIHGFWSHYGEAELGLDNNATHWMPLPPAPLSASKETVTAVERSDCVCGGGDCSQCPR